MLWFLDKLYEILSPEFVHKDRQQSPKSALFVFHTNCFCNQTWQGQSAMLSLDLLISFSYMSKHCSILVMSSYSNEFIFCEIRFSFTQQYEMQLFDQLSKTKLFYQQTTSMVVWYSQSKQMQPISVVSTNQYLSILVLLFSTLLCSHLFSMLYFSGSVKIACFM